MGLIKIKHNIKSLGVKALKKVDIIVGIPSYNEADNIDYVVRQVDQGLSKYYPKLKALIINVDNNSPDGTRQVFENTQTKNAKLYITTKAGIAGKGYNFYNLFKKAQELSAKLIIVVDADLKSIKPGWVRDLGEPILKQNYDFITPVYARHEYDGSITNHLCYPLFYGLLGKNIRQPIGGDFAMSGKLVKYLRQQPWTTTTKKYGIDIFLTSQAVFGKFKIGQSNLGAKIHKPSAPKLGPMFSQVVTTLFINLVKHKNFWLQDLANSKLPVFYQKPSQEPQALAVDYKGMKATALYLFSINKAYLKKFLTPEVYQELNKMHQAKKMDLKPKLWAKVLYDMLYAFDNYHVNSHFILAFKPLYFWRAASFIKHSLEMTHQEAEKDIMAQAKVFYRDRGYLLKKYR